MVESAAGPSAGVTTEATDFSHQVLNTATLGLSYFPSPSSSVCSQFQPRRSATAWGRRASAEVSTASSILPSMVETTTVSALPDGESVVKPAVRLMAASVASVADRAGSFATSPRRVFTRCTGPQSQKPADELGQSGPGLLFQFTSQPRSGLIECGICSNGTMPCQSELPSPGCGKKGFAPRARIGILPAWKWAMLPRASA